MASTTFFGFFYYYKYLWPQNIRLKLCWIMRRYLNWMFYKPPKKEMYGFGWFWQVFLIFPFGSHYEIMKIKVMSFNHENLLVRNVSIWVRWPCRLESNHVHRRAYEDEENGMGCSQ